VRVRLYIPEAEKGKEATLSSEQIRHLKVLRLKEGDKIGIFDGKGHEYEAAYSAKVSDGKIIIEAEVEAQKEPTDITLAIAAPKGSRIDVLVEKVSEIGAKHIVPIVFQRSIVEPRATKIERLKKIAIEAACQSGRSIVPAISEPIKFEELLATVKEYDNAYLCHKTGEEIERLGKNVLLIVGPEGDLTQEEIEKAKQAGCRLLKLGPTILRTETAGIVAVAKAAKGL